MQLAAAPWVNTDVLSRSRHDRCFPRQGEFAMPGFTAAALDAGYTGPLPGDAHRVALFDPPPPPVVASRIGHNELTIPALRDYRQRGSVAFCWK